MEEIEQNYRKINKFFGDKLLESTVKDLTIHIQNNFFFIIIILLIGNFWSSSIGAGAICWSNFEYREPF